MSRRDISARTRLSVGVRLYLAGAALAIVGALVVATVVTPDPRGYGSHESLGLAPCTFRALFGRPCPTCGMTTAWAYLVRGDVVHAAQANLGGTMLAAFGVALLPGLVASAALGRAWPLRPSTTLIGTVATLVAGIALVEWLARLVTSS